MSSHNSVRQMALLFGRRLIVWTAILGLLAMYGSVAVAVPLPIPTTDLELWLRADALNGLDGNNNPLPVPGSPTAVTTWTDISGNGRDQTQGSVGNQPTFTPSGFGSLPAVNFDGNDQTIGPLLTTNSDYTIFIVEANKVLPGNYSRYMSAATTGGSVDRLLLGAQLGDGNVGTYQFGIQSTGAAPTSSSQIITYLLDSSAAGAASVQRNAAQLGSNITYTQTNLDEVTFGGYEGSFTQQTFQGDIAEIIIYSRSLTDGTVSIYDNELNDIHYYLDQKYSLNLGLEATPIFVPEPATCLLLGVGSLGMIRIARRRRRRA